MKKYLLMLFSLVLIFALGGCELQPQTENKPESKVEQNDESQVKETEKEDKNEETKTEKGIDLEALRAIENADTFPVKVTGTKAEKGLCDDGSPVVDLSGEDGIVITVQNNTSAVINDISFLILCTDENGKGCDLGALSSTLPAVITGNANVVKFSDHVKIMGTDNANHAANSTDEYILKCSLNKISNVNAIVYSYIDANGKEIINETYKEWLPKTLDVTVY